MHCFRTILATCLLAVAATGATAQCLLCDEVVEIDQTYADCFRAQYAEYLAKLETSGNGRVQVNLGVCNGTQTEAERSGLTTMPTLDSGIQSRRMKSIYVLDEPYLRCLKNLLDRHPGSFDPSVEFDLYEKCGT